VSSSAELYSELLRSSRIPNRSVIAISAVVLDHADDCPNLKKLRLPRIQEIQSRTMLSRE
jgi:hypothetical protein